MIRKTIVAVLAVLMLAVLLMAYEVAINTENIDYTKADIIFTVDDSALVSEIVLFCDNGLSPETIAVAALTLPDTFALTGLMNGTTYNYRLKTTDSLSAVHLSPRLRFTTTDLEQTLTIPDSTITHEGATIWWNGVEADTGVAKVRLYVYNVEDSVWAAGLVDSLVPRMTVTDTATVSWDTTVVNPLNSDSVFLVWNTVRDSVADYSGAWTDTSIGDSASASFSKTGLQPLTWYYFAGVVCSATVYDSLDIDSLYTSVLPDSFIAVTGLEEGETYYVASTALDSGLTDSSEITSFTTTDLSGTLTIGASTTPTTVPITVTANTSTDFNGVDSVNLFEGFTSDSLTDVATSTLSETLTVSWDTTVVNPLNSDSVFFYWHLTRDSVANFAASAATDTSTGDSASAEFTKTGLQSATLYYYSAVVCSADVYDSLDIDSTTTTGSFSPTFSRTGKIRGSWLYYFAQVFDSIYCDTTAMDSVNIPNLKEWSSVDLIFYWTNPAHLPSKIFNEIEDVETIYYTCHWSGGTFATDSTYLVIYDETFGLSSVIDTAGSLISADSGSIAIDSVDCKGKGQVKFAMIYGGGGTVVDNDIGYMNMYIEISERPF